MAWAILDTESAPGQETPHVMTTWHTDEPEQEVVFFAFNLTNFDEHDFRKYLVLTIGHDSVVRNRLEKLIRSTLIPS
jgi:UDP-N-acetylmuramyl pentapeptide synthase